MIKFATKYTYLILHDFLNDETSYAYIPISVLAVIGFPFFYIFWLHAGHQIYENLFLRIIAIIISIPLLLHKFWPKNLKLCKPIYWHIYLIYIIPFFFTFMLLKNNGSIVWQINNIVVLVLLILLVNWRLFFTIWILGMLIGSIAYIKTTNQPQLPPNFVSTSINYIPVLLFCGFFLHKKSKIHQEKLQAIKSISQTIAHELRTPLSIIGMISDTLKKHLPTLLHCYDTTQGNIEEKISEAEYKEIATSPHDIQTEVQSSFNFINMLWTNVNLSEILTKKLSVINMKECIEEAIKRYTFTPEEKNIIKYDLTNDFQFKGHLELMVHVLFNLFKNALYHVTDYQSFTIKIWMENKNKYNYLYFEDTGPGIDKKHLSHIFERFYTKTLHGTGIGLAFCKEVIESFDGDISCQSEKNKYTRFIIELPKIVE